MQRRLARAIETLVYTGIVLLVLGAWTASAAACSCWSVSTEQALIRADLVAEVELIDVEPPLDPSSDFTSQRLRFRLVRVFKGPRGLTDDDEVTTIYTTCNSDPFDRGSIGSRAILFFGYRRGAFEHDYCSPSRSAWEPLPYALIESRRLWRESQR
jgi:hypothetical protein